MKTITVERTIVQSILIAVLETESERQVAERAAAMPGDRWTTEPSATYQIRDEFPIV